jgi:tetratricopeptide (TPR) repeat protein
MTGEEPGGTHNEIHGGVFNGPVLQGRDFRDVTIEVTVQAAPAPVALDQLPAVSAGFTGRDAELAVLAGLLHPAGEAGAVVVSAVAGLAGVGKTTLAVRAGHAARDRGWFPGGVLFIDLRGYDDQPVGPAQALDALLRALGVAAEHIPPGTAERAGLYRSVLAQIGEAVLVIADNASAEAQVQPLLPGAGRHRVLVTSRHTLAGLGARLLDVAVLGDTAAVTLLDAVLRAARPGDDRITADRGAAARLAAACGGLPLALQITASILTADPTLTAAELATELDAETARLERLAYDDGSGTAAPSVAAAFELSYRRLDEPQARLFRLLSVSPGPDISTAAVAALDGGPDVQARVLLSALGRAHLAEPAPGAAGRWRMHDLLRLYARQLSGQDAAADGREQAIDRLLGYYLNMAGAADEHLWVLPGNPVPAQFPGRNSALAWMDAERPSLTAAVIMAAEAGRHRMAVRLAVSLGEYLQWRRRFDDMLAVAEAGRDAARRLGDRNAESGALNNLSVAFRALRRFEEAITASRDAATIARETGDRAGHGSALNNLGIALEDVRRFEEAITAYQGALAINRETGDRSGEGKALNNLGVALRKVRRFEEAISAHWAAAEIARETGNRTSEGKALNNLGGALVGLGRFEEAIGAYQGHRAICRETGDRHGEGNALTGLGIALQQVGRFDQAITVHYNAALIFRETGDRNSEGTALNNLGVTLAGVGRSEEASIAFQDAVVIYRETGDAHSEGRSADNLARSRAAQKG